MWAPSLGGGPASRVFCYISLSNRRRPFSRSSPPTTPPTSYWWFACFAAFATAEKEKDIRIVDWEIILSFNLAAPPSKTSPPSRFYLIRQYLLHGVSHTFQRRPYLICTPEKKKVTCLLCSWLINTLLLPWVRTNHPRKMQNHQMYAVLAPSSSYRCYHCRRRCLVALLTCLPDAFSLSTFCPMRSV